MPLSKLEERALLTDRVFDAIRASIMNGEMPAGHRLRVHDLAAQVGTSIMPVREAIRRLEEAGLAERQPHKGAVVKGLTLSELVHVYDVRRLLEVEAARLGAATVAAGDVDRMEHEYAAMRTAIDDKRAIAMLDHDEAFLTILYEASGNPFLVNAIRALWEQCRSYKIVGAHATLNADDQAPLWTYQAQLLEAARDNAPELAARVNGESLGNATDRIRDQLATEAAGADPATQPA
jgi:DNA-binding GntR family transcriptional regulator